MKYQQLKIITLLLGSSMLLSACGAGNSPSRNTANNLDWEYYGDDEGIIANPKGVKPGQRDLLSKGVPSVMRVASSYEQAGQYASALELYLRAIGRYPGAASPKVAAGRLYSMAGEWGAASRLLESAMDIRPDTKSIQLELAQAYMLSGNIELSRALLNQIPDTEKLAVNKKILLGQGYDLEGNADQAQAYYFQALDLDPRSTEVLTNISLSLALNQHFEDAVEMLQPNLSRPSTRDAARENLALIYALSGQPKAALALARASLSDEDLGNNLKYYESLPLLDYTDRVRAIFTREIERSDVIARIRNRNISDNESVNLIADNGNEGLDASEIDQSFAAITEQDVEMSPEALLDGNGDADDTTLIVRRGFDDSSSLLVREAGDDLTGEANKQRDAATLIVNRNKEISPRADLAATNTLENAAVSNDQLSVDDTAPMMDNPPATIESNSELPAKEIINSEVPIISEIADDEPQNPAVSADGDVAASNAALAVDEVATRQAAHSGAVEQTSPADSERAATEALIEDATVIEADAMELAPSEMTADPVPLEVMMERPFRIQFVSVETPAAADDEWCRLHEKIEKSSADLEPVLRRAELDDGSIRYRMLLAGFEEYSTASFRCEILQEDGIGCFVVRGNAEDLQPLTSRCKKANELTSNGR